MLLFLTVFKESMSPSRNFISYVECSNIYLWMLSVNLSVILSVTFPVANVLSHVVNVISTIKKGIDVYLISYLFLILTSCFYVAFTEFFVRV